MNLLSPLQACYSHGCFKDIGNSKKNTRQDSMSHMKDFHSTVPSICRDQQNLVTYLNSSELNYRPDALRDHVQIWCPLRGKDGKVGSILRSKHGNVNGSLYVKRTVSELFTRAWIGGKAKRMRKQQGTLSLKISSAVTRTSPQALSPFRTGYQRSLGVMFTSELSFTRGEQMLLPKNSSLP